MLWLLDFFLSFSFPDATNAAFLSSSTSTVSTSLLALFLQMPNLHLEHRLCPGRYMSAHHLLTLMPFQPCMTFSLLWGPKEECLTL